MTSYTHLKLNYTANPRAFASDASKTTYAASFFRDKASDWFEPRLRSGEAARLTWKGFEAVYLHSYRDPDHKHKITRELQLIRQTDSATSYATSSFQLFSQLGWNDEALQAQFCEGLREDVKDALSLANYELKTVQDLADIAVPLDNRLA